MNNGGVWLRDTFNDISDFNVVNRIYNVNTLAPIALIKGFLPKLIEQNNQGQIVNILSLSSLVGVPGMSIYSSSKYALDGFGKALQGEVQQKGINICQIYP